MDTPPTIQFDLLTGIRGHDKKIGIVQVQMDLTKLDTEPLCTHDAAIPYPAFDTWASPLLFNGVPAVLCASDNGDDSRIFIVPYPQRTVQGEYTKWSNPLQEVLVRGMSHQNWHGLEALSDKHFLVADSATKRDSRAYGGCLDFLDAKDPSNKKNGDVDLESAHAVIWDPTSQRIFALGARLLRVYSLDPPHQRAGGPATLHPEGEADFTALYEGREMDGRGTDAEGGHDLYFMAGERRFFLTTGERCFTVDIDRLLRDLKQAKEPNVSGEIKRVVWQNTDDGAIDRFVSLFKVKSKASDDHFHDKPKYPRDKVGAKAINRIPGTSVTFVHSIPYYVPESVNYLSNILLVSRGEYDRPNLYDRKPGNTSTNLRMILQSDSYRCRVMPRLPTSKVNQCLHVPEAAKLQFCDWTGSLGKVGSPYLRVTGMDQKICDLFPTLTVPPTVDGDNNIYGYCVIEQAGCQREAIIRIHQYTETCLDDYDGMLVGDNPKRLAVVYAWAAPFVLNWKARETSDGLTVTVDTVRPADQKLESVAAWLRTTQDPSGYMMQLSKIDIQKGSFSETIPSKPQPFYSIMLFAKSMEGFLYCSGEQLVGAEGKSDEVEP